MFGILDPICSINLNDLPKDAFHVEVASCKNPVSKHLPEKVVRACTEGLHTPINPHAQRLLTAEARSTGRVPRGEPKKSATPKSRAKGQKPKGAKRQDATSAGVEVGKKKGKTEKEKQEASGVSRTEYAAAKKEFMMMDELLVSIRCSSLLGYALLYTPIPSIMTFKSPSEVGRIHAEGQRAMVTKLKPSLEWGICFFTQCVFWYVNKMSIKIGCGIFG